MFLNASLCTHVQFGGKMVLYIWLFYLIISLLVLLLFWNNHQSLGNGFKHVFLLLTFNLQPREHDPIRLISLLKFDGELNHHLVLLWAPWKQLSVISPTGD